MKKVLVLVCLGVALSSAAPVAAQEVEENPCANVLSYYSPPIDAIVEPGGFFPNINAAVAATPNNNGDNWLTICVNPGSYPGGVFIDEVATGGLNVHIVGIKGSSDTFVEGAQTPAGVRGFEIRGDAASSQPWDVVLRGLTVRNFILNYIPAPLPWRAGGAALRATDTALSLEGFDVLNNNSGNPGGAISVFEASLTYDSGKLEDNQSTGLGGALFVGASTPFALRKLDLIHNRAGTGGGVFLGGTLDGEGFLVAPGAGGTIENCHFTDNHAIHGGALAAQWVTLIDTLSSTFVNNSADEFGGAVHLDRDMQLGTTPPASAQFTDSTFEGNTADVLQNVQGGAVWTNWSQTGFDTVEWFGNQAGGSNSVGDGGAVFCVGSINGTLTALDVRDSVFEENVASKPSSSNGFARGGAVAIMEHCEGSITDSAFERNVAEKGGGVAIREARLTGSGLWMTENFTGGGTTPFQGGAIWASDIGNMPVPTPPPVQIHNSYLADNKAEHSGGAARFDCRTVSSSNPSVEITTSEITGNEVVGYGGLPSPSGGGGLSVVGCGAIIDGVMLTKNAAPLGGGLRVVHDAGMMASQPSLGVTVMNSIFKDNNATAGGGVVLDGGRLALIDSGFESNHATVHGGGFASLSNVLTNEEVRMERVALVLNSTEGLGDAIFFRGDGFMGTEVLVAHNTFKGRDVGVAAYFTPTPGQQTTPLDIQLDAVTVAGNSRTDEGSYVGLWIEETFAGSVVGSVWTSVLAMNQTSPGLAWQALGLTGLSVFDVLAYHHDPSELDPGVLTDATGGVVGDNPLFYGGDSADDSSNDVNPWCSSCGWSWYDYGGLPGGPVGPSGASSSPDKRGAFSVSQWCAGLKPDYCVP